MEPNPSPSSRHLLPSQPQALHIKLQGYFEVSDILFPYSPPSRQTSRPTPGSLKNAQRARRGIFQKTFRYLWRFYSLLFRGFFVFFSWLFRAPLLSIKTVFGPFSFLFRGFFVAFSWLFRGPRFGQILRVLALEQSSES